MSQKQQLTLRTRNAVATGSLAARIAGTSPSITPMNHAQMTFTA